MNTGLGSGPLFGGELARGGEREKGMIGCHCRKPPCSAMTAIYVITSVALSILGLFAGLFIVRQFE